MIEKPEWQLLCENPILRQYFLDLSKGMTRNPELQEDLYQEAWLRIGEYLDKHPGGKTLEFYQKGGKRAMRAYYMREWRYWKRFGDYYFNKEALRKRIERAEKKFEKHVREMGLSRD